MRFNGLICSPEYHKYLIGVVIDEAHCIVQWGGDFRPTYAKLDKLRLYIPTHIPIYATSATMTQSILSEVRKVLHIRSSTFFHLNLGNNRQNIYQEVRLIRNSTDFSALAFLFDGVMEVKQLERALIFINKVSNAQLGWQWSQERLPTHLRSYIRFLHARRSEHSKHDELEYFRHGKRHVLWVTEIGGMVGSRHLGDRLLVMTECK